jgi:hypothetical protein
MVAISLAILRLASRVIENSYDEGWDFFDKDADLTGRKDIAREDAASKWFLYEDEFGGDKVMFVFIRGSSADPSHWTGDDVGNFNMVEIAVPYGSHTVRFHEGFFRAGLDIWAKISHIVWNCGKPVIFVGHSRGASLAHVLHVFASNIFPEKAKEHFSLAFAPIPAVDGMGAAIEDNAYAFVLNQDPVPRLTRDNMVTYEKETGNATEAILQALSDFGPGFGAPHLVLFAWESAWGPIREFAKSGQKSNITKLVGKVYWLQNQYVGMAGWNKDKPQKALSEYRVSGDQIGLLNYWGLADHLPPIHRLSQFLDELPCEPTKKADFAVKKVGDSIPGRCDDESNWECPPGANCTYPASSHICNEDVKWRSEDSEILCENPEPNYWWAILIGVLGGVAIIAVVVGLVVWYRKKKSQPVVEAGAPAEQSP